MLHAALGVDVGARLLGVGGARQDDVGAVRAGIAMRADIDDEGVAGRGHVDLVGAEQEQHVACRPQHAGDVLAALARHEAEIERRRRATAAVCSTVKPFQSVARRR